MVACRLSKYFKASESFLPERWTRDAGRDDINPYLVLPFGHGMRACIARRLAEQSMLVLMIRVSNFVGRMICKCNTHIINVFSWFESLRLAGQEVNIWMSRRN